MDISAILLVIVIAAAAWGIAIYNRLIKLRNQSDEAWSGIDVQLKRRHNLIPNLIETVKGYQKHESELLTEVTELRGKAVNTNEVGEKGKAESALSLGLGKLIAISENYPDLKANTNFIELHKSLSDVEDQIQSARRYYNGTVRNYNTQQETFPGILLASPCGFTLKTYFELSDEAERAVPKVKFS
jgi:LemA protein